MSLDYVTVRQNLHSRECTRGHFERSGNATFAL